MPVSKEKIQAGGWIQTAMFFSMGRVHDYSPDLKKIKAPTLILYGEDDLIPASSIQLYLDNIPNHQYKTIPKSTHFPFEEQPEVFGNMVADFLL